MCDWYLSKRARTRGQTSVLRARSCMYSFGISCFMFLFIVDSILICSFSYIIRCVCLCPPRCHAAACLPIRTPIDRFVPWYWWHFVCAYLCVWLKTIAKHSIVIERTEQYCTNSHTQTHARPTWDSKRRTKPEVYAETERTDAARLSSCVRRIFRLHFIRL